MMKFFTVDVEKYDVLKNSELIKFCSNLTLCALNLLCNSIFQPLSSLGTISGLFIIELHPKKKN